MVFYMIKGALSIYSVALAWIWALIISSAAVAAAAFAVANVQSLRLQVSVCQASLKGWNSHFLLLLNGNGR